MQLVDLGVERIAMLAPDEYILEIPDYDGVMLCKEEEAYMPYIYVFTGKVIPEQEFNFETELDLLKREASDYDTFVEEVVDKCYFKYMYDIEDMYIHEYTILFTNVQFTLQLVFSLGQEGTDIEKSYVEEVEKMIETIGFMFEAHHECLVITAEEERYIEESIGDILGTDREGVQVCLQSGKALDVLQWLLDEQCFNLKDKEYIVKLGLMLGTLLQYYYLDFNWVAVEEEGVRELAMQFKDTEEVVFPISLVSSRIETGEAIRIPRMLENLFFTVEERHKERGIK